jgi:hypothetical protein
MKYRHKIAVYKNLLIITFMLYVSALSDYLEACNLNVSIYLLVMYF